ncbi:MAG: B12-binding domain-containing radical SAM protein [Candidatus Hermodarchaeota archaeon]
MSDKRILLTTPTYPYPTLPANDSLTDATGQRFTHGDDIFTIISHTHCFGNHILAQNINTPSTLLEYPRWKHFTKEVDKGYDYIGISCFPVHLDNVLKMCEYVRENSPDTTILLGSYGAQAFKAKYDEETQKKYVDYAVKGEGVKFLRNLLGEDADRPIEQKLMPKCGGSLWFIDKYPRGTIGFLVSGLGCPGACDFCSTTEMFGYKRIQMLSPEELIKHMHLYHKYFPDVSQIFVIEEDHFRYPEYLIKTKEYWESNPEVVESLDWFAFGSVDHIWNFADKYGWDAISEIGIGAIFIGVESKFAGEHGYTKVKEADAREVFNNLHNMGIRTIGAWICGWDFHDHSNIYEDLNYFVACYPTYEQLTRLSPFPGTVLYNKMKKSGRIRDVPWEDVHFWSGSQENVALEIHETLNLTEYGYDLIYKTWGPSVLRKMDVILRGYEYCLNSDNPVMRDHKSQFFKHQAAVLQSVCGAMDRFAPNGVVRRRVRKIDQKYRDLIGDPSAIQNILSRNLEKRAKNLKIRNFLDPINRYPKEEPAKKYLYLKNKKIAEGDIPYKTQLLSGKPFDLRWNKFRFNQRSAFLSFLSKLKSNKMDTGLDKHIIKGLKKQTIASAF